jgi:D-amino-acid dehydrogenase
VKKALVVGGGLVGLNVALQLQSDGFGTTLVEPEGERTAASFGNAGHVAVEQVEPLASMKTVRSAPGRLYPRGALSLPLGAVGHWLPFSLRLLRAARQDRFDRGKAVLAALLAEAMPAWRRRVADLGAPDLLREDGHFIAWESSSSATAGLAAWRGADTGVARVRAVTDEEHARLDALTRRRIAGAARFEGSGQVSDLRRLLERLEAAFLERGGEIRRERASQIETRGANARCRLAVGAVLDAEAIVVCAGVWSRSLLAPLGLAVPITAEYGYHIQAERHGWPAGHPPVVFEDRSMIVTGFDQGLRAASFVEFASPDARPDPRKWARLKAHVRELGLPFGDLDAASCWFGARPTLPDYLPAIGRADGLENLYYAFGHQHLGLTLAPVTAEIVAAMTNGDAPPPALSLQRFQKVTSQ